ncbi:hypothetical protein AAHB50_31580 [Bacillus toyonensis]
MGGLIKIGVKIGIKIIKKVAVKRSNSLLSNSIISFYNRYIFLFDNNIKRRQLFINCLLLI